VKEGYGRMVNVSKQEAVYRPVPVSRVLVKGHAIPPCPVEASIRESCYFGKYVEQTFPNDIPAKQLFKKQREEQVGNQPWEFFPSFIE
jgi:hypothetical protein